ncbi:hypothetical protein CH373_03335 [Leptospira perolatii]|uniref:Uncharacterized protein n=1 Tax=Leptospira perolatii TaxID=2023191 RepID=A0A2M9ZT15_9LEPT|nr:hypothetical protein [Leptospira perolatii]PJZ71531.1 hypothetical protein CH360_03330 [Leptospira perolatii]PJZ75063.1 hypothetical protein CH373_03335 [Leptospira perolatii]
MENPVPQNGHERIPNQPSKETCKKYKIAWIPIQLLSYEKTLFDPEFYSERKRGFFLKLPKILETYCIKTIRCSLFDGENPKPKVESDSRDHSENILEIKILGIDKKIHWSLYASSFSLLIFPGFFRESLHLEITKAQGENRINPVQLGTPTIKNWFGWIFFLWGPLASYSEEDLFLDVLEQALN